MYVDFNISTSSPSIVIVHLFHYSHPSGCEVVSLCDLTCIFLVAKDTEYLFTCWLAVCILSFGEMLIYFKSCWYILATSSLSDIWFPKNFSLSVACFLHVLDGVLWSTNIFNFDVDFIYFACASGAIPKKPLLSPRSQRFTPMLSSKTCSFSLHLCLDTSGINFLIWCERGVQLHSFACFQLSQHRLWKKTILSPFTRPGTLSKINWL